MRKHLSKVSKSAALLHLDRLERDLPNGALFEQRFDSVAYEFDDTSVLEDVYQGRTKFFGYGRQGSPTTSALENRISHLEDGIGSLVFSSGMAAYDSVYSTIARSGDHIIASRYLFSNTLSLLESYKSRWGLEVDYVDPTEIENVASCLKSNTIAVLVETVSNPTTIVPCMHAIGDFCEVNNIAFIVDNTVTGPLAFSPKAAKASLVIHSLTKGISGHGRSLGGSVTDTGCYDWLNGKIILEDSCIDSNGFLYLKQLRKKGRSEKGSMPSNHEIAQISMGMETLPLRSTQSASTANKLAEMLSLNPNIDRVWYPGLDTHDQHEYCKEHFANFGALLSFSLNGKKPGEFLDRLSLIVTSSSLGDTRTLAIPPATTIFHDISRESRELMDIPDGMIRMSVGIEPPGDLISDIEQALS
ncbi:MAG: hypothetical protein GKR97_17770 [Rhizobiaceae bacterium]|nr:hypothetical protein [Rhizobiaceae bacterium]